MIPLPLRIIEDLLLERCFLLRRGLSDAFLVGSVLFVCTEEPVAPSERGGEVLDVKYWLVVGKEERGGGRGATYVYECHVVEIVVVCACPEWDDMLKRPRKV
jgi:hypothetical protein